MFDIKQKLKDYFDSITIASSHLPASNIIKEEIIDEFERLTTNNKELITELEKSLIHIPKLEQELDLANIEISHLKTLLASSEKALENRDKTIHNLRYDDKTSII